MARAHAFTEERPVGRPFRIAERRNFLADLKNFFRKKHLN